MEFRNLQYFLKIAEYENMTRAAKELHVAQPALSRAVRLLEAELGRPLFDRNGKNIKLNYMGRVAKERITMAFAIIDGLYSSPSDAADRLDLCLKTMSGPVMRMISDFRKISPDINVCISNIQGRIRIVSDVAGDKNSESRPAGCTILNEEMFLIIPTGVQGYGLDIFSLADFCDVPFIMPLKSDSIRGNVETLCEMVGFAPKVAYETDNPALAEELVAAGMGVAFWPDMSWGKDSGNKTLRIHIQKPICWRNISLVWEPNTTLSHAEERFIDFSSNYFLSLP